MRCPQRMGEKAEDGRAFFADDTLLRQGSGGQVGCYSLEQSIGNERE
jgi:hypothetical protein